MRNNASRWQIAFRDLKENWRHDLMAGFQVFLIALPLCLGISIASGFPPMAGLIAAIIGGLLVSRISGAHVTINGPAAGLIVVILDGVHRLGKGDAVLGYKLTLAAIVCAGLIQVVFGLLRAGKLSAFFPVSAVHGMLTAIGIIIMAKQVHVVLGVKPEAKGILETILAIPHSLTHLNPMVALIGFSSLAVLMIHPRLPWRSVRSIPAPLMAIALGVVLSQFLGLGVAHTYTFQGQDYSVGPDLLLNLTGSFTQAITFPDFSGVVSFDFLIVVVSIALIASLETILSAMAVDKLDPEKRKSDLNRDVFAIGVGTTISGLLGGLPMIAEIVRSSANVNSGAKSQWSNFFHGFFLLSFILLAPQILRMIPLASLAALLVFTGFRLASPHEFRRMKLVGWDQLGVFLITIVGTLATDLLLGIAMGIGTKILIHFVRIVPIQNFVKAQFTLTPQEHRGYYLKIHGPLIFSNYLTLTRAIDTITRNSHVSVSLHDATFVDHTVMEYLHQLEREFAAGGGSFELEGHDEHHKYSLHPLAARRLKTKTHTI